MDCYGVSELDSKIMFVILNNAKILFRWFMFRPGELHAFPISLMLNIYYR